MAQYLYKKGNLKIKSNSYETENTELMDIKTVVFWGDKIVKEINNNTATTYEIKAVKLESLDLANSIEETIFIKMYNTFVEREGWKKATQKRIEKTKNHLLENNEFYKELTDFIKTETEK